MKLSLGTVQFGLPYGINNNVGIPSDIEIKNILDVAAQNEIKFLDSSSAYGDAEKKIGKLAGKHFQIISKVVKVTSASDMEECLAHSLADLKRNHIYGYLFHHADELIHDTTLWTALEKIKQKGSVKKIGYSIYTTDQLDKLLSLSFIPDLIQLPYSLLDRKFEPYLPQLKKLGTEIHVRSAFLQGLYFMDPKALPAKLSPLKSALEELNVLCEEFNIPVSSIALNFLTTNVNIDQVVIGVESSGQLINNIKMLNTPIQYTELINEIGHIEVSNKELLNPANW